MHSVSPEGVVLGSSRDGGLLCYVMLCNVMLCYVMLCYVMLCYVVLCYFMLCYVVLCFVMLCFVVLYFTLENTRIMNYTSCIMYTMRLPMLLCISISYIVMLLYDNTAAILSHPILYLLNAEYCVLQTHTNTHTHTHTNTHTHKHTHTNTHTLTTLFKYRRRKFTF
jgi:hypothetical protein